MIPPCRGGRSSNVGLVWIDNRLSNAARIPSPVGMPSGSVPSSSTTPLREMMRGGRVAPDEGEACPPLGTLDRLQQEAWTVTDQLDVGSDRCLQVGQQRRPHGHDRM